MSRWILRQRRLLALTLLLGVVLCAVQTLTEPRRYTATAHLRIQDDRLLRAIRIQPLTAEEKGNSFPPAEVGAKHFNDLMQNTLPGSFVDEAIRKARLTSQLPVQPVASKAGTTEGRRELDPRFETFRRSVWAHAAAPNVLAIELIWNDEEECENLVQAFTEAFIDQDGMAKQAQVVAGTVFLDSEIARVKKQLQNLVAGERDAAAETGTEGHRRTLQVEIEAVQQHLKELYARRMEWALQANAQRVTQTSAIILQNLIFAEPTVTPERMLAQAPGRLLRCTLISFVLVLAGAALRQILLRRRTRKLER